jgi:hypothetical protein
MPVAFSQIFKFCVPSVKNIYNHIQIKESFNSVQVSCKIYFGEYGNSFYIMFIFVIWDKGLNNIICKNVENNITHQW